MPAHTWHATFATQADDLRKALDWSLHLSNDPLLGIKLAGAGLPLWRELSLAVESNRNCERALAEFDRSGCTDVSLRLKLVTGLATSTMYLANHPAKTVALFETALQLARETGDAHTECHILGALAMYPLRPWREGETPEVLQAMRHAAARTNDRSPLWEQEHLCAEWDILSCDFSSAHERLEKISAEMRDRPKGPVACFHLDQEARANTVLAAVKFLTGKPASALTVTETAAQCDIPAQPGARYTRVTLQKVVRRLIIAAILAISLGAPIVELFDSWDQTLQTGSDTEANVAVVALCIGVAFAIGTIVVVNRIRALASASARRVALPLASPRPIASLLIPAPTVSPPAILRV